MSQYKSILHLWLTNVSLRNFNIGIGLCSIVFWMQVGALPVFIMMVFNSSTAMVIGLTLRLLPRIIFAPFAGVIIHKFGARTVIRFTITANIILLLYLPWAHEFYLLQIVIVLLGILDVVFIPSILALRAVVIPPGWNSASNALFQSVDSISKMIAPPIGAYAVSMLFYAPHSAYILFSALLFISFLIFHFMLKIDTPAAERSSERLVKNAWAVMIDAMHQLREHRFLIAVIVPSMCYMITFGATQPFLFLWNQDYLGAQREAWGILLTAQGLGALCGGFLCMWLGPWIDRRKNLVMAYLIASILEGVTSLMVLTTDTHLAASIYLFLGGFPEMLSYVIYFSLIQKTIEESQQVNFYALTGPLVFIFYTIGTALSSTYTEGFVSLQTFWIIACALTIISSVYFIVQSDIKLAHDQKA